MIYRTKLLVSVSHVTKVLAALIKEELSEFTVSDDRGGTGHWAIETEEIGGKRSRRILRRVYRRIDPAYVNYEKENL